MSVYFDRLLLSVEIKDNISICILSCFRPVKGHIHKSRPHGGTGIMSKVDKCDNLQFPLKFAKFTPFYGIMNLVGAAQ